jgi:hypothetical protein
VAKVKLHHTHAAAQASRVELHDLNQVWRGEGGNLPVKRDVAHRLATCWNVLEGIPTEALLDGALRDLFAAVDAGDLAGAQAIVARFDARIERTADGSAHDCAGCRMREQEDDPA